MGFLGIDIHIPCKNTHKDETGESLLINSPSNEFFREADVFRKSTNEFLCDECAGQSQSTDESLKKE